MAHIKSLRPNNNEELSTFHLKSEESSLKSYLLEYSTHFNLGRWMLKARIVRLTLNLHVEKCTGEILLKYVKTGKTGRIR